MKKTSIFLFLVIFLVSFSYAIEDVSNEEEVENLQNYGERAYFVYLGLLILLGIGVLIAGLLIQNNFGTKNFLIYLAFVLVITSVIVFW